LRARACARLRATACARHRLVSAWAASSGLDEPTLRALIQSIPPPPRPPPPGSGDRAAPLAADEPAVHRMTAEEMEAWLSKGPGRAGAAQRVGPRGVATTAQQQPCNDH
jgi:hypothetical protein